MKHFLTFTLLVNVLLNASAQEKPVYSANSAWVRINSKGHIPIKTLVTIDDDFTKPTNPYGWRTSELAGTSYQRGNGIYKVIKSAAATDVITVIDAKCSLDSVDFLLETTIVSKTEKSPRAGIVWGYTDKDNYMAFKMNSLGEYAFIFMNSGENVAGTVYKPSPEINKKSKNKLTIKKQGIELLFLINDKLVYTAQYVYLNTTRVGFISSDKEVDFEKFKFQQLSN